MAAEWFYTTNKQQMGPVTWDELRELAEVGILKLHDLIWTEGMDEWVKGINQPGLFADGAAEESASSGKKSSYAAPKPPPGRRTRRKDEVEEDEEDDKEAKKKARKKQEQRAKMAVGVKVGLILAAVVFVLLFLGCAGVGLVVLTGFGGGGAPIAPYAINNLQERKHLDKRFNFKQNQRVIITVNNTRPNMNVVLMVFRGNDLNNPFQQVPQVNQTCRAEFVIPSRDSYTVRVANFGPGAANTLNVTIEMR
jgi:hypothetical protein